MDLVTGATGFIGNVLVRKLVGRGIRVRAFTRPNSDFSFLEGLPVERAVGNIIDIKSLIRAFKGVDTVYHLAGRVSIMPGGNKLMNEINLQGTRNVLKACRKVKVKKLIFTSTIHALEEPPEGTVISENMPYDTGTIRGEYDRSKANASIEVIEEAKKGLHTVVLCPTGIIGPYDWKISAISRTLIDYYNGKMKIGVDGAYDFVDVRDVAMGHILAASKAKPGDNYILSGERVTMRRMFGILEELTGVKSPSIYLPVGIAKAYCFFTPAYYRFTGKEPRYTNYTLATIQSNSYISHKKADKLLGYKPRTARESMRDAFEWLRESGFIK
jgi:dihydroflavonol-4-reductase